MHNLIRKTAPDPELTLWHLKTLPHAALPAATGMSVNRALSLSVRPGIEAPDGYMLAWCDLSAIEARVLPWLSADPEAEPLLDLFRRGRDVYVAEAAKIFGIPQEDVTPEQRQTGKVAILSLGFGGAVGALTAMARNYGLSLDPVTARWIVDAWRAANRWAVRYWDTLRDAAEAALDMPGTLVRAGRVQYLYASQLLRGSLLAVLPCGRWIVYRGVRRAEIDKYGRKAIAIVYEHPQYGASELATTIASENVTQAAAASILREAVVWLAEHYHVIAHTHDEIVIEVREEAIDGAAAALAEAMTFSPDWADGLPLAAAAEIGFRYKVPAG
jgi:DNA polymerase